MKCRIKTDGARHQLTIGGRSMVLRKNFPIELELSKADIKTLKSSRFVSVEEVEVKKVVSEKKVVKPKGEIEKVLKEEVKVTDFEKEAPTVVETPKKEDVKNTISNILQDKDSKKGKKKGKEKNKK